MPAEVHQIAVLGSQGNHVCSRFGFYKLLEGFCHFQLFMPDPPSKKLFEARSGFSTLETDAEAVDTPSQMCQLG